MRSSSDPSGVWQARGAAALQESSARQLVAQQRGLLAGVCRRWGAAALYAALTTWRHAVQQTTLRGLQARADSRPIRTPFRLSLCAS